ncbi:MAG: coenzyme F420-0:L-glutamate ligase [Methanothrix sp.]|uniref:cytidine deaminase n=1 Tax=Methanothrix thermoacetophila (strain DSM 6194 / JCM 14653 / NBRC 101360 / PT) TaxID=349307 RepID=A0B969_METTP|nr:MULTISPECIES: coenzyme F420-0:L-glutamate ligase [Methanothrix]ABK15243.1 cytidine deaminase [Methanothrix thermoacetophila PT]MBC7079173.1 coenzyme F420-0:L-glutamate ligase [Methanothrix sp.]NPU86637.1 coenzyme F420-0:L-glutamate ligase [Methanothrix sp.]
MLEIFGIKTGLLKPGEDHVEALRRGLAEAGIRLRDKDVIVVSESFVATGEGRVVSLKDITPSARAIALASRYEKDPAEMELILRESDEILGGIPGVVLTLKDGFLYPNAGVDHSNAPPGYVVLLPSDPKRAASRIRTELSNGVRIGVIIGDSRTHPLRLGCVGVALACDGIIPVEDARGRRDLYGKPLRITVKAVADNLVSAAQLVMGEGDEGIPAVVIRGAPVELSDSGPAAIPNIPPHECMYIGVLRSIPRPYTGEYDDLIKSAIDARDQAYAPYSKFRVGAAVLCGSGKIYKGANVENASSGAGICAERVAMATAVAAGEREFVALAVAGELSKPITPCGICRQMMIEFGDMDVVMVGSNGDALMVRASELLPDAFTLSCRSGCP